MKEKKRLEIVWETHDITRITFAHGFSSRFFCRLCAREALFVTVRQASSILKFAEVSIFRGVETDQVHSIETAQGTLLICSNSLSGLAQE